jgi:hypothetical protein
MDLKYGDKTRTMKEANNNYQGAKRMRKKLTKIQDTESEISAQCSYTKLRSILINAQKKEVN